MSFASQFHMPGAYHFDAPPAPSSGPTLSAGIFRPPLSPSASSSVLNLAKSTGSLYSDAAAAAPHPHGRRKRTRDDAAREATPADWTSMHVDDAISPLGELETPGEGNGNGVRHRYTLAGQIETPGATVGGSHNPLEDSIYSDIDYRRALGSKRGHEEMESPSNRPGSLRLGANGQDGGSAEGWTVFGTLGGVVVKMWEFCKAGAFKGFTAGGGEGFGPSGAPRHASVANGKLWCNEHDVPTLQGDEPRLGAPGAFPEPYGASNGNYNSRTSSPDPTPRRPSAKRRQVSEAGDSLHRNWVLVDSDSSQSRNPPSRRHPVSTSYTPTARRPAPPNRRISIPVSRLSGGSAQQQPRRSSARISHAGSPSLSTREPASFAPTRSPVAPSHPTFPSPSRIPGPANPFARAASPRPGSRHSMASPTTTTVSAFGHRRNTSAASAATVVGSRRKTTVEDIEASPRLDAEAKKLAARKLLSERDTDARIEVFNNRLRDMIRQGKEALGTTVRVEEGEEGGMWMDDE